MENLHLFRLLAVSLHCLVVFGNYCNLIVQDKILKESSECSQETHYYCSYMDTDRRRSIYTCFNVNISQVSEEIGYRDTYILIVIKNSSILTLSQVVANTWNNVQVLRIEETNTYKIIPGFFNNFKNLIELSIVKNKIKTISDGTFNSLFELYTLNLTENLIETVNQHSFSGLSNLRVLDLSKNRITTLPEDVFENQNDLLYVDISDNLLKSLGSIFIKHYSLTTINVSRNFLSEFDFNQLHNNSNYITKIDLSSNIIHKVTYTVHAIYFEDISLAYNKISTLPKISNLKKLNISHNHIQNTDGSLLSETLQSLDVSSNNISALSAKIFRNLTNLQCLNFAHNNLSVLQVDALHNLHKLKHLDLSFNQIRQIPFGFFNDFEVLTYLDLSDNDMVLDFHTLTTLKSLEVFKFSRNKVQTFDSDILLSRFKFLKSISFSGNSWNCTELASIVHKFQLNNINLTAGQNKNVSNILGISCQDNIDSKEDSIIIERTKDVGFYPSAEKIDNILKNTSFLKYLQTIAEHIFDNKSIPTLNSSQNEILYKFVENLNIYVANISNSLINMQEYNNKSMGYIREMFNHTIFLNKSSVKTDSAYLPEVQSDWSTMFNQTLTDLIKNMISWQNKSFNEISNNIKQTPNFGWSEMNQTLINLTNSLNNMKQVFDSDAVSVDENKESKALISEKHEEVNNNNGVIFTNMFLGMILCCLLFFAYRNLFKPKITSAQEQVQLM